LHLDRQGQSRWNAQRRAQEHIPLTALGEQQARDLSIRLAGSGAAMVAGLGLLTWGLHLDGLADTADRFAPLGDPAAGLAAMRRSDIGAFGAAAVSQTLLIQCGALSRDIALGRGISTVIVAVVAERLAMTSAGVPGVPATRPHGLGASVTGSVPRSMAWFLIGLAVSGTLAPAALGSPVTAVRLTAALAAALAAGLLLRRRAVRRFGGVTRDILGPSTEWRPRPRC
jgi:adenosylcobinamide-GDP ribazoletransferase